MKVELQIKETYEEEKLIVQTPQPTEKVQKVIEFAENLDQKETIKGKIDDQVYLVKISKNLALLYRESQGSCRNCISYLHY